MKKDVLISIKGIQMIDEEFDTIELFTCARFYRKNDNYYLSYEESESTGFEGCRTTLKIEDGHRVTMRRMGAVNSNLVIEKGSRHQCCYDTGLGPIVVGISGDKIKSTLTDQGGEVDFSYSMDVNTVLASEHRVIISVKEC